MMGGAQRKPVQVAGHRGPLCFCNHTLEEHGPKSACPLYQARPCKCGHPFSSHSKRCNEKWCSCKSYSADRSPDFLLRRGVREGQWQFMPTGDLDAMTTPRFEFKTRVLAVLAMATLGQKDEKRGRGRIARITDAKTGKVRTLRPQDIVVKLRSKESLPGTTKGHVRRALEELDVQDGLVRRFGSLEEGEDSTPINGGRRKGRVLLALYFKPRKVSRKLKAAPKEPLEAPDFGVQIWTPKICNSAEPKPLTEAYFAQSCSRLCATVVKSFREAVRAALDAAPNLGVKLGPQNLIDEVVAEIEMGVRSGYQKLFLGSSSGAIYKEDSITSSSASSPGFIDRRPLSSSSAFPGKTKPEEEEAESDLYHIFKAEYPAGHFDGPDAKPSFDGKTKAEQLHAIERLRIFKNSERWKDEGGRWIPRASKWLASAYSEEPPPAIKKKARATAAGESDSQLTSILQGFQEREEQRKKARRSHE